MLNKYQKSLNFIKNVCLIDFTLLDDRQQSIPINKTQIDAYNNLKELVDKSVAKKPYKHEKDYYVCPCCDCAVTKSVTAKLYNTDYCNTCGQCLD